MRYLKQPLLSLPAEDVEKFITGYHPEYPDERIKCQWIAGAYGFRPTDGIGYKKKDRKSGKLDPRKSGKWLFEVPDDFSGVVAKGYIRCNGKMNCTLDANNQCSVRLKLEYTDQKICNIFSTTDAPSHGDNFMLIQLAGQESSENG